MKKNVFVRGMVLDKVVEEGC